MPLILRSTKGTPLTNTEVDGNFTFLDQGKQDKVAGKGLSTNDYTTVEKTKLAGIATGATANSSDATLVNRANHTGTQLASTISNFAAAVRDTVLTGIVFTQIAAVLATDSILAAIGKLQAQITKGGWGGATFTDTTVTDVNGSTYSRQFAINTGTANTPKQRGTTTDMVPGSTGITSVWSTQHQQMLIFSRTEPSIAYRRMNAGAWQPDDYLVLYPTGQNFLAINQGGTGGATAAAAQTALGLVPVSNTLDRTAGRLLTPGWLGLGDAMPITPGQDYNTLTQPAEYFYGSGAAPTNAPIVPAHLISVKGRGIYPYQEVRQIYGNLVYQRSAKVANPTASAADWNPWDVNLTGLNAVLDPALNLGGIVFAGSNGNGFFTKFADGSLICWQHRTSTQVTTSTTVGTGFQSSSSVGYTFPVAFVATADVQVSPVASYVSGSSQPWAVATGKTLTGVSILAMAFHNNVVATCGYIATGRWK